MRKNRKGAPAGRPLSALYRGGKNRYNGAVRREAAPLPKVYFMRHGETDWNRENRLQGQADCPLNETGLAQARRAGERIAAAGLRFDAVYSSPLIRALETARLAAGAAPSDIRRDERLQEMSYGPYEGMAFGQLRRDREMTAFLRDPERVPAPAGVESIPALMERTGAFLRALETAGEETVLVVTHGVAMRAIFGHLSGGQDAVWGENIDNCTLYETVWDGEGWTPAGKTEL